MASASRNQWLNTAEQFAAPVVGDGIVSPRILRKRDFTGTIGEWNRSGSVSEWRVFQDQSARFRGEIEGGT